MASLFSVKRKSKKGVSPLIAAVLLIAFTVSVSMIIMGWFSTFIRSTTTNISESSEEAVGCSMADVSIDHIYIVSSTNTTQVVVKNIGFVDLTVKGTIMNTTGASCINKTGVSIGKGESGSLAFSDCKGMNSTASFDRVIVTTSCSGIYDVIKSTSYVTFG